MVGVQTKGKPATRVGLRNISRGGAMLVCDWALSPGIALELDLPEAGATVPARVARCGNGERAVVLGSEPHALAQIVRALGALTQMRRAA
jgi:hypothetical protein